MENKIQIVISAPSGSGKTTLINMLLDEDDSYKFSISTTTRAKRKGEINGKDYYFVSIQDFEKIIEQDEFIEWAKVYGNYYGTTKKEIDRIRRAGNIPIFDIDVQGCKALRGKLKEGIFIFIIPPSIKILEERLRKRKTESDEQIKIRLETAVEELKEYELYDYIVINGNLDVAVNQLHSIVTAEQCRRENVLKDIKKILESKNDNST